MTITLKSHSDVALAQVLATDLMVVKAARTSSNNQDNDLPEEKVRGLINYLMKKRHGTPFEHNMFTFAIDTPIMVVRQFFRHRVGWSYNELSGRYSEIPMEFYMPSDDRPLQQIGSSAHPDLVEGTDHQRQVLEQVFTEVYHTAEESYHFLLTAGIAREVARTILPLGTFTRFYTTCNARSLMHFLSLRVNSEEATYESKPQAEIDEVAQVMETYFAEAMPHTYAAFVKNGRVAP